MCVWGGGGVLSHDGPVKGEGVEIEWGRESGKGGGTLHNTAMRESCEGLSHDADSCPGKSLY